jgi:hypothetical protein
MKRTTISGQSVFVMYHVPNWQDSVGCSFSVLTDSERGLTGKEDRTPLSRSLRVNLEYTILLTRETSIEFRKDLKDVKNSPVLCPFWPAQSEYSSSDKAGISAGLWVAWEPGWDTWEVYLDGASPGTFTPSANAQKAPLLWGKLAVGTSPEAITDEVQECDISFVENSPVTYALTVDEQVFKGGPGDEYMFPVLPNWAKKVEAGIVKFDIVANEVGFGRETADAFYDQDGARMVDQTSACVGWGAFKKMLRFFFDHQGDVGPFWIPMSVADCRAVSIQNSPPDTVTVSDTDSDFDGDYEYSATPDRWEKGETHWIEKTGGQWEMSDGTTTYTAPDNGLNVPPDEFTQTIDVPQTIDVVGAGSTNVNTTYNFEYIDEKPMWTDGGDLYIYWHPAPASVWYIFQIGVGSLYVNTNDTYLPEKTGWSVKEGKGVSPAPTLEYDLTITASVSASTAMAGSELEVSDNHPFESGDYLSLISAGSASGFTVSGVDGNTITLAEPLDRVYQPSTTTVSTLLLARFNAPLLELDFITDELAITNVSLVEVPKEYTEEDSGEQDAIAYLYTFSLDKYDPWRFTSYEENLVYATNTYSAKPFSHSNIVESVNLDKNELELSSRYFWDAESIPARNPLGYFLPFKLEATMSLEIHQAVLDSSGTVQSAVMIFKGQVVNASFDGPYISARCQGISSLFDRLVPNILLQPTCNYAVYSDSCGLLSDDWKMAASVVEYTAGSYEIIIQTPAFTKVSPTTRPSTTEVFEHYFAGGRFESGSGASFEARGIMDSVAIESNIKLTLRHPLDSAPLPSDTIFIWPGCDGKVETCKLYNEVSNPTGKFDNYDRFGGFPFVPIGNPSLSKVNKDISEGGKK